MKIKWLITWGREGECPYKIPLESPTNMCVCVFVCGDVCMRVVVCGYSFFTHTTSEPGLNTRKKAATTALTDTQDRYQLSREVAQHKTNKIQIK